MPLYGFLSAGVLFLVPLALCTQASASGHRGSSLSVFGLCQWFEGGTVRSSKNLSFRTILRLEATVKTPLMAWGTFFKKGIQEDWGELACFGWRLCEPEILKPVGHKQPSCSIVSRKVTSSVVIIAKLVCLPPYCCHPSSSFHYHYKMPVIVALACYCCFATIMGAMNIWST